MTDQGSELRLAIIDDYANTAPKHFQHIPGLVIDAFPATLDPAKPHDLEILIERLKPYTIISSMRERTPFPANVLSRLPNLKLLLNSSKRNRGIDMEAATAHGIIVTGTSGIESLDPEKRAALSADPPPPAGYNYVIQHAWALLLALCSRIAEADREIKQPGTSSWQETGFATSLGGKTLGILGLGKLGVAMAKIAVQSFDMKIIAWSENLTAEKAEEAAVGVGLEKSAFTTVSKDQLFADADVVSLHNVLSERSRGVVGAAELALMKRNSMLINTSRGGLIDEQALIATLTVGTIGGVALDVFWEEPLSPDSPWRDSNTWARSAVVLSPHMGYMFSGLIERFYQEQAEIVEAWIEGREVKPRMN